MFISKIRSSDDDVTKLKSMVSLSDDKKKSEFKSQIRVLQTSYRVSILTFCERHLWFFVKMTFCLGVKNQVSKNEFSMTTRFHDDVTLNIFVEYYTKYSRSNTNVPKQMFVCVA